MKKFIVKVQVEYTHFQKVLIYNEDRSFMQEMPFTKHIDRYMKGNLKEYFFAHFDDKGNPVLGEKAPWQDW